MKFTFNFFLKFSSSISRRCLSSVNMSIKLSCSLLSSSNFLVDSCSWTWSRSISVSLKNPSKSSLTEFHHYYYKNKLQIDSIAGTTERSKDLEIMLSVPRMKTDKGTWTSSTSYPNSTSDGKLLITSSSHINTYKAFIHRNAAILETLNIKFSSNLSFKWFGSLSFML